MHHIFEHAIGLYRQHRAQGADRVWATDMAVMETVTEYLTSDALDLFQFYLQNQTVLSRHMPDTPDLDQPLENLVQFQITRSVERYLDVLIPEALSSGHLTAIITDDEIEIEWGSTSAL